MTQPTGAHKNFLHYNPERTDYTVTGEELSQLENAGSNLWKDICLVSAPVGISCMINALTMTTTPFELTLSLFLNYLLGSVGIAMAVVFAIAWKKTSKSSSNIFQQIKTKPKIELVPSATSVGALAPVAAEPAQAPGPPPPG